MKTKITKLPHPLKTFRADIYIGLQDLYDGKVHDVKDVEVICQAYVDHIGLAVTVTPTLFVYTGGNEPGVVVGLINYPRFPSTEVVILEHAKSIAYECLVQLNQERISIVTTTQTIMIEKDNEVPMP